jgi:histidine ammonia-lyase
MGHIFTITNEPLSIEKAIEVVTTDNRIELSEESKTNVLNSRRSLNEMIDDGGVYYGINTGFGSLCDIKIPAQEIEQLQLNLIRSHAAGVGEEIPESIVRLILFLKIKSLSLGYSGVSTTTLGQLISLFNHRIHPVIYSLGSLGASGDLAPLAHLSLPLIGEGVANYNGKQRPAIEALGEAQLDPIQLQSKDGLALLNGTQFSTAFGVYAVFHAQRLSMLADLCASLSLIAFAGRKEPFFEKVQSIRNQTGQIEVARRILNLLNRCSGFSDENVVQDPYSFRCVPQVHGASYSAIKHVDDIVTSEMNSVTDNPIIISEDKSIISGGNFHAQPIALSLDYLATALSEFASISERRTYKLLAGKRGLPAYLCENPGIQSGLMIAQYTAASVVSQNKQLCTPSSVDSIISANGQEDHVSMAANAATKLYRVVKNVETVLCIEFFSAVQALGYRKDLSLPKDLLDLLMFYREVVPQLTEDQSLRGYFEETRTFTRSHSKDIKQLFDI